MLSAILDRIRFKKRQFAMNSQEAYYALLKEVAAGDEIDADQAAITIDSAGKTESEFEADVSKMTERIGLASQLNRKKEVEKLVPKLEAEHEETKRNYDAAIAKLSPIVADAYQRATAAQNEQLQLMGVESRLIGTCMNPAIFEREAELLALRLELFEKRSPLAEDLRHAETYLRSAEIGLDGARQAKTKHKNDLPSQNEKQKAINESLNSLEYREGIIRQLSNAIDQLDAELRPIDSEIASLQVRKLVP